MKELLWTGTLDTLKIVLTSTFFASLGGLPLGILLTIWKKDNIAPFPLGEKILAGIVNIVRSIPFIILIIALLPIIRVVVGKGYGVPASIFALSVGAIPFVARVVESALLEVDDLLIKAAITMGATPLQIIFKVYLVEALPNLVRSLSLTMITLVGYAAMAGVVGGGGLGDIAIRYGLHRREHDVMFITIIIMVIMVQLIQTLFNTIANRIDKRRA